MAVHALLHYEDACKKAGKTPEDLPGPAQWVPASSREELVADGEKVGIQAAKQASGEDIAGLQYLLTYGLKGTAAYADHAMILGKEDNDVYAFFHEALDYLAGENPTVDELLGLCLRCGEVNLKVMGLLGLFNLAKNIGLIHEVRPLINDLMTKKFRISEKVTEEALKKAGEPPINL